MQVLNEIAKAFLAGSHRFLRLLAGSNVPYDGQSAELSIQFNQRPRKLGYASFSRLRQAHKLLVSDF